MSRDPSLRARVLVATLALAAAAAGAAAGAWQAPERASVGPLSARAPDVAVNGRGDAAAAWIRGSGRASMIVVSRKGTSDAGWTRPEAISRRGRPAVDPQVAVDEAGRVVVVWRQVARTRILRTGRRARTQAVYTVRARERRPEESRWDRIQTLSSSRQKAGRPDLAIDGNGVAVAVWHWGSGTRPSDPDYEAQIQVAQSLTAQPWSPPGAVSGSAGCEALRRPRVDVSGGGHAVVWWQCGLPDDRATALSAARGPSQAFGSERELPFATDRRVDADLAVAPDGTVVAVAADGEGLRFWRGSLGSDGVGLRELPMVGPAPGVDRDAGPPQVAVNSDDDALAAWIASGGRATGAVIAADLGVAAPTALDREGQAPTGARVAVGEGRRGMVGWTAMGRVHASSRANDGSLGPGALVSGFGVRADTAPALAMDDAGRAVAFWTRFSRSRTVVERASATTP